MNGDQTLALVMKMSYNWTKTHLEGAVDELKDMKRHTLRLRTQ